MEVSNHKNAKDIKEAGPARSLETSGFKAQRSAPREQNYSILRIALRIHGSQSYEKPL